jgi:hypothetical protein
MNAERKICSIDMLLIRGFGDRSGSLTDACASVAFKRPINVTIIVTNTLVVAIDEKFALRMIRT